MGNVSLVIVDQALENDGLRTNAAFVIGLTAGRELPTHTFGYDVCDGDGNSHRYLTKIGHFVRKAGQAKLRTLRQKFLENPAIKIVDYTEDAAPSNYDDYSTSLKNAAGEKISYRAIWVYGPEEAIVPLTKNLSKLT